jgi:hypothetical protein
MRSVALRLRRLGAVAAVVPAVVLVGGGAAWAYWTTTGSGAGTGAAQTFQTVTVAAGAAPAGQLYPGLVADGTTSGGDLVLDVTNPNPFPVTVTVSQSGPATGCTTTGVTMSGSATFSVPASSGPTTRTLVKVLSMSTAATDDCQGAAITVPLSVSATS